MKRSTRKHYYDPNLPRLKGEQDHDSYIPGEGRRETTNVDLANLVSSELLDGTHLPALDIDFKARLVRSQSEGHFHLYLDGMKPLTWRQYRRLLKALARAGVIEPGYYRASKARKATMLRKEW